MAQLYNTFPSKHLVGVLIRDTNKPKEGQAKATFTARFEKAVASRCCATPKPGIHRKGGDSAGYVLERWSNESSHVNINTEYYTQQTDTFLDTFYPKHCCGQKLTKCDGKRDFVLRCPVCHRQQSKLAGTPLHHLKLPRWMFGFVLRESSLTYPKVLTAPEIERKLGISYKSAFLLKKRLQLMAHQLVPMMHTKFFKVMEQLYKGFDLPHDETQDLTGFAKKVPIPHVDSVVLYSAGNRANKGRKRFKRKGQTSSIYMSESLGGRQIGTLVQTLGVARGPVFFDSISDQKATTLIPLIRKYIPLHTPLFSDAGYKFYPGKNHRMVNHSLSSKDKRYRYSKNRWSYLGVNCNTAEGNQSKLKRAFSAYGWINPKYSQLYLDEYTFLGNLRHFSVNDLLESNPQSNRGYLNSPFHLRGLGSEMISKKKPKTSHKISNQLGTCLFEAKTLLEIQREAEQSEIASLNQIWAAEPDKTIRQTLRAEYQRYLEWFQAKPTKDQRRSQRYFEGLANKLWPLLGTDSYMELRELADEAKLSTRLLFRVLSAWVDRGLVEMVNRNRPTKSKASYVYDIRRRAENLTKVLYVLPKEKQPELFKQFRRLTKTEVKWRNNGK